MNLSEVVQLLDNGGTPTAIRILAVLQDANDPMSLEEIIEAADLSVSAAKSAISTLTKQHKVSYLTKNRHRQYSIVLSEAEYRRRRLGNSM